MPLVAEAPPAHRERGGIAVDAEHLRAAPPERLRVAAVAQRRVDGAARPRRRGEDRGQQHRDVNRVRGVGHVRALGRITKHPVRWDGVAVQQRERG